MAQHLSAPQAYKSFALRALQNWESAASLQNCSSLKCKAILICFLKVQGGGGVAEAKIRVEARRALTCDDQTVGSVMCAVY